MKYLFLLGTILFGNTLYSQELFVSTEPASNMAKNSLAFRISAEGVMETDFKSRTSLGVMYGLTKDLMIQASSSFSDFYQRKTLRDGYSFYGKYRFLNVDNFQRHFRGAVYARYADVKYPIVHDEINLGGENNGVEAGLVFTQLLHKLGLSGSVGYVWSLDKFDAVLPGHEQFHDNAHRSLMYTFSSGYRVFPLTYSDYRQVNVNLYVEFLGDTHPETGRKLFDVSPAIQLIFNSKFRLDIAKSKQLWGDMQRRFKDMYMVQVEYNLFNAF